ncbi:uncharacterized protein LOC135389441 [Ornithodoros turicata]|uniref:uncharacterized protein LOC135389441 n=1 Tax=Ornithodoros turicata TaxID=34597 RepID=UPI00313883D9
MVPSSVPIPPSRTPLPSQDGAATSNFRQRPCTYTRQPTVQGKAPLRELHNYNLPGPLSSVAQAVSRKRRNLSGHDSDDPVYPVKKRFWRDVTIEPSYSLKQTVSSACQVDSAFAQNLCEDTDHFRYQDEPFIQDLHPDYRPVPHDDYPRQGNTTGHYIDLGLRPPQHSTHDDVETFPQSSNCSRQGQPMTPVMDGQVTGQVRDARKSTGFERTVFTLLVDLKRSMKRLEKKVEEISTALSQQENYSALDLPNFPIVTDTDLQSFNRRLLEADFKAKLVTMIARLGGNTLQETVRIVMKKLIHNSLALQYSLKGAQ